MTTFEEWKNLNDIFDACNYIRADWQMSVGGGKLEESRAECAKYLRWRLQNWQPYGWGGNSPANVSYDNAVKNLVMATLNIYEEAKR